MNHDWDDKIKHYKCTYVYNWLKFLKLIQWMLDNSSNKIIWNMKYEVRRVIMYMYVCMCKIAHAREFQNENKVDLPTNAHDRVQLVWFARRKNVGRYINTHTRVLCCIINSNNFYQFFIIFVLYIII